jgi:hypothetical protein
MSKYYLSGVLALLSVSMLFTAGCSKSDTDSSSRDMYAVMVSPTSESDTEEINIGDVDNSETENIQIGASDDSYDDIQIISDDSMSVGGSDLDISDTSISEDVIMGCINDTTMTYGANDFASTFGADDWIIEKSDSAYLVAANDKYGSDSKLYLYSANWYDDNISTEEDLTQNGFVGYDIQFDTDMLDLSSIPMSWSDITFGSTAEDIISVFGEPDSTDGSYTYYTDSNFSRISFFVDEDAGLYRVSVLIF